jgi:hypothetical protein
LLLAFLFYLVGDVNFMRQVLLLTTLLLFACFAFGQKKQLPPPGPPKPPTKAENARWEKHDRCSYLYRYSAKQRRGFYPFGAATSIRLISFEESWLWYGRSRTNVAIPAEDTLRTFSPMDANKFYINYCQVKEYKDLSEAGIDSLTDMVYNVGYTPVKNLGVPTIRELQCYEPRNAILFLDAKGKVTQYIKFCFKCRKYYYSSAKTKPVEYCEQKYDMIAALFLKQGVKYGAKKRSD